MAYQMTLTPVILNNLEGHAPVAVLFKCNSSTICAVFYQISNDTLRRAVTLRQLGFLFVAFFVSFVLYFLAASEFRASPLLVGMHERAFAIWLSVCLSQNGILSKRLNGWS